MAEPCNDNAPVNSSFYDRCTSPAGITVVVVGVLVAVVVLAFAVMGKRNVSPHAAGFLPGAVAGEVQSLVA
jgi:hypothetical protein